MTEELQKKVDRAIKLIQSASKIANENGCPEIEVAYSGGKDSDVILELTKMAKVPYVAIYKNTTIDAIGTIKHVKDRGAKIIRPKYSFLELLSMNGYPNMFYRHCCRYLKEYKILDYAILGIRRSESKKRALRYKEPEQCRVYSKNQKVRQYMPILEWSDSDVEEFIKEKQIKCAPVYYDENGVFHVKRRLGCVGCPLASSKKRIEQFKKYPNMVKLYIRGGQKYLDTHNECEQHIYFTDAYEWFCRELFCKSYKDFESKFGANLFNEKIDCKMFLENYFNIKFK